MRLASAEVGSFWAVDAGLGYFGVAALATSVQCVLELRFDKVIIQRVSWLLHDGVMVNPAVGAYLII